MWEGKLVLCGNVKEFKPLESTVRLLREWSQCLLQLGAWAFLSKLGITVSPTYPQACAPLWSRACGSSVFTSGICARVDASFQPQESLAPTAQRKAWGLIPRREGWMAKRERNGVMPGRSLHGYSHGCKHFMSPNNSDTLRKPSLHAVI